MSTVLQTRLCALLGIEAPIFCAPMGFVTGPELAAAVSNAGGLGIMSFSLNPPAGLRSEIARLRSLTDRPFGVNVLLAVIDGMPFSAEDIVGVCVEERVPLLSFFAGDAAPFVGQAHAAGIKVALQVRSVAEAKQAAADGVDIVIVQGYEAGGHSESSVALTALVPRVFDAVAPVPVVAAGGIGDARGLVAALALGAEAVALGTRFIATPEASAHPLYKDRLVAATEEETVRTTLFGYEWPNAPHRVLRTRFVEQWLSHEQETQGPRPDAPRIGETQIGDQTLPLYRFMGLPPSARTRGDIDSMALYAGQGVGLVDAVVPAGEIVRELVEGAQELVERLFLGAIAVDRV